MMIHLVEKYQGENNSRYARLPQSVSRPELLAYTRQDAVLRIGDNTYL